MRRLPLDSLAARADLVYISYLRYISSFLELPHLVCGGSVRVALFVLFSLFFFSLQDVGWDELDELIVEDVQDFAA